MKQLAILFTFLFSSCLLQAQEKKTTSRKEAVTNDLTDIKTSILATQANAGLYTVNARDHSQEHDVNSIILDIEKYIDSMHRVRTYSDQLLMKLFNPLRHFFLTTSNKTTVATMFLYSSTPYRFCKYNDSAVALHLGAVKDGTIYNLAKMTETAVAKSSFNNCLLPSLKALDEFRENEPKYIAVSVYYGCKDSREGATRPLVAYCLTLVAKASDLQQYADGLITTKGLAANAEIYLASEESPNDLRRIQLFSE